MRIRRLRSCFVALSFAAVAACSSHPSPPDLAGQLQADTGVEWTVLRDPLSHEVRFLAPKTPVQIPGGTPEDKARLFFARYRDALHASGQADELEYVSLAQDSRGGSHIRFQHHLPGSTLAVFDAGSTAHFTKDGSVYWLETDFHEDLANVDGKANVDEGSAKAAAEGAVQGSCASSSAKASSSELGVYAKPGRASALAYRISVDTSDGTCLAPAALIDSKSGATLDVLDEAVGFDTVAAGSRYFRVKDDTDQKSINVTPLAGNVAGYQMVSDDESSVQTVTADFTSGKTIETSDLAHWDEQSTGPGAAADSQYHVRRAATFLRGIPATYQAFGDYAYPLSTNIKALVHANKNREVKGCGSFTNVHRIDGFDVVAFGDSDLTLCPQTLPYSAAYDVVVHEVAHLVTERTMRPNHLAAESGALAESFSDVMGAYAEHAVDPRDEKNFLVGEDLFYANPTDFGPGAARSLTAPRSVPPVDPTRRVPIDHVDDIPPCAVPNTANDFCNSHSNAGIPSRAFSLTVQGGQVMRYEGASAVEVRPISVPDGIGWDMAAELRYWATTGLTSNATFENAAAAERSEASRIAYETLDSSAYTAVVCAWAAVGVLRDPATQLFAGAACQLPALPPPPNQPGNLCAGHGDAFVCDPSAPEEAIKCQGGAPTKETVTCADVALRCKTTSGDDPTAVLDGDGIIVCE